MTIWKILEKILIYSFAFMLSVIIMFPIISMISTSLKSWSELWISPAIWIPNTIYFDNYIKVWQKIGTGLGLTIYFRNSMIIASGTVLLSLMLSIPAAYTISRYKFKGRKEFMFLILITQNDSTYYFNYVFIYDYENVWTIKYLLRCNFNNLNF